MNLLNNISKFSDELKKQQCKAGFYTLIICNCGHSEMFFVEFTKPLNFQCQKCGNLQGFIGRNHSN